MVSGDDMKFIKRVERREAFSLIEVNMAVFVMAVGILSMVVLYPLGLRESTQGQADLKQSMLADFVLNQAVAIASQTNITWSAWKQIPVANSSGSNYEGWPASIFPKYGEVEEPNIWKGGSGSRWRVTCARGGEGMSDKIMGIMVQSTDLDFLKNSYQYSNNPIYYAEVMFQGDPNK